MTTFREREHALAPDRPESKPLPPAAGLRAGNLEFLWDDQSASGTWLLCPACFTYWEVSDIGQAYNVAQQHGGDVAASRFVLRHLTQIWCYRCLWHSGPLTTLGAAYVAAKDHVTTGHAG